MARLGSLAPGTPAALELLQPGSLWRLAAPLNLFSRPGGSGLATQAATGRCLEVLQPEQAYQLRDRKLQQLQPLEPQAIVSANIGCIQHLQTGTTTPVKHWVEVLDEALNTAPQRLD
jgi:hypothetical protein